MKEVTLIEENRLGLLSDISYILGKSNVHIDSIDLVTVGKNVLVTLLVKDPEKTVSVLQENGFKTADSDSILVRTPNLPESKNIISNMLSKENILIEELYLLSSDQENNVFMLKTDHQRKATRVLSDVLLNHV